MTWAVRAALRRIRPSLLVLAELELWPNLISSAAARDVKVAVVNGRLGEKSFRGYSRIRALVRRLLNRLDLVAVQNAEYRGRFAALGCDDERLVTTGSLKFDGAAGDRNNPTTRRLAQLAGFEESDVVFLAGSTQEGEEEIALEAYRSLAAEFPQLRLVLVPRHAERFDEVARILERSGTSFVRRSMLSSLSSEGRDVRSSPGEGDVVPRVLLIDAIGELGAWWGTSHIAFVGGSFGDRGGQNMLEPAAYGAAVSFGPNTWNFREIAGALVAAGGAVVLSQPSELAPFVRRCLTDVKFVADLGRRAGELVAANRGATVRTVELLLPLLDVESEAASARLPVEAARQNRAA
ncbi:MAG: glycosyltransferase N-terminal domain-containing protein [Pirellulales bacterium]